MIFIDYNNRKPPLHTTYRQKAVFLAYVYLFSAQRNQSFNVFSLREHIVRRYG